MQTWTTIKDNENYEINELSQIRHKRFKKVLTQNISGTGYLTVKLGNTKYVHTLMAHTYLNHAYGNTGDICDHISENKLDNTLTNLQIITRSQNALKSIAHKKQLILNK